MNVEYYAVINRADSRIVTPTLYRTKKAAKIALKNNFNQRAWSELAVAHVTINSEIVAVTDTSGKWEEVSEDDVT